jgi:hypothetical protein
VDRSTAAPSATRRNLIRFRAIATAAAGAQRIGRSATEDPRPSGADPGLAGRALGWVVDRGARRAGAPAWVRKRPADVGHRSRVVLPKSR